MAETALPPQARVLCNAKVNLYLKVGARRPDGFHEIETVYHSIALADGMTVSPRAGSFSVDSNSRAMPLDDSNLAVRAARRILGAGARGAHIAIEKVIPIGSGLGGGSADAAGALVSLNRLYGLGLSMADLELMAGDLGSDTRFMLRGGCAIGRGTGTDLEWLPPLPPFPLLVVVPRITISTAWAYDSLKMGLTTPKSRLTMVIGSLGKGDVTGLCDLLENDFEGLIFERFPMIERIRHDLVRHGARGALLSGSGSAVYGVFEEAESAQRAREAFIRQGFEVFSAVFAVRGVTTPR
jgi:4-diphosphocytidyl-2-C-methyl-D-erythritol kinase